MPFGIMFTQFSCFVKELLMICFTLQAATRPRGDSRGPGNLRMCKLDTE